MAPNIPEPLTRSRAEDVSENNLTCSLCGTSLYQPTPYGNFVLNPAIRLAYGTAAKVEVRLTVGEQEWDWGAGETTHFDLCPACFEHKLMVWLRQQGAVPRVESWIR